MLVVKCKEHYEEVKEFARSIDKIDQLQNKLDYLGGYGENVETCCFLYKDFAEYSFYFEMHIQGRFWFNGGVIYHGDETGWGVHT